MKKIALLVVALLLSFLSTATYASDQVKPLPVFTTPILKTMQVTVISCYYTSAYSNTICCFATSCYTITYTTNSYGMPTNISYTSTTGSCGNNNVIHNVTYHRPPGEDGSVDAVEEDTNIKELTYRIVSSGSDN
jgi:hypothetical protein